MKSVILPSRLSFSGRFRINMTQFDLHGVCEKFVQKLTRIFTPRTAILGKKIKVGRKVVSAIKNRETFVEKIHFLRIGTMYTVHNGIPNKAAFV